MTLIRFATIATLWTLAALGVLQLRNVRFEHAMCLPGRCGPPLGAILSMHGFWALGIGTAVISALYLLPKLPLRKVGTIIVATALIGMTIVIVRDYYNWQPATYLSGKPEVSSLDYHVRRFFFPVITMTDLPFLQLTVGGAVLALCAPRIRTTDAENTIESTG